MMGMKHLGYVVTRYLFFFYSGDITCTILCTKFSLFVVHLETSGSLGTRLFVLLTRCMYRYLLHLMEGLKAHVS